MSTQPRKEGTPSRRPGGQVLDHLAVQRGIKHAWFAQELAVSLEQAVRDPADFALQAGVRLTDLRRLMSGEELDRVSVDALLRVVIQGRIQLQVSAFSRPTA